jgi:hypothetical protein
MKTIFPPAFVGAGVAFSSVGFGVAFGVAGFGVGAGAAGCVGLQAASNKPTIASRAIKSSILPLVRISFLLI